ncbi:hypothetical protein MJO29_016659 [Puccinia striiformis f. sp. tritici]|nr:hypothetical protein MJO29_016659 [Puccinia striiformis f. sp. tritici]
MSDVEVEDEASQASIVILVKSPWKLEAVVTAENEDKPSEIWSAIVDRYASASINNKARIWLKFMRYEYGGDLKNYLVDCQKMIREFSIVHLGIPDDIISISVLAKLSKDYWNVVDNIIMNESIIFFPSRTLRKLQELVYMKETRTSTTTSKTEPNFKVKKDSAIAYKTEAEKPKRPKPAHPCSPGKHNPLAYHPAWRCYKLSNEERNALCPKEDEAAAHTHSASVEVPIDEDNFDVVDVDAYIFSASTAGNSPVLDSGASHHMMSYMLPTYKGHLFL